MAETTAEPIRVLIVDDHPTTLAGIQAILGSAPDIEIVGKATTGAEAEALVAELRPDILLLDLMLPDRPPLEVERWVRRHYPETITLILTAHNRDDLLSQAVEMEVAGYVTKDITPHRLVQAVRAAANFEQLLTVEQYERAQEWERQVREPWEALTAREREVLMHLAQGKSQQEVAETLQITVRTVETHVTHLLSKLDATTTREAVVWVRKHGLVNDDEST
jgi:NarL family two-component system response regulator LiaR